MFKSRLPLNGKQFVDLIAAFPELRQAFGREGCRYDENFSRIVVRQEHFTATFFYTGAVIVCGNTTEASVSDFLDVMWTDFFKKNTRRRTI